MSSSPIRLDFNFPRVLISRCSSFFEFRVSNDDPNGIDKVTLILDCPALGLQAHRTEISGIPSGTSRMAHIDTIPEGIGAHVLRVQALISQGHQHQTFHGTLTDAIVYERPESPANLSIVIQDIQSHRSESDRAEFGAIKGDVNIEISDLLPKIQSINDLIKLRLPDAFIGVDLLSHDAHHAHPQLRIPESFCSFLQPAKAIALQPATRAHSEEQPGTHRLLSGDIKELILGRSSLDCNLCTRFLPATPENLARSKALSRQHACLTIGSDALIHVRNITARGGVVFAGPQSVDSGHTAPLPPGSALVLGHKPAEYKLRCHLTPPNPRAFPGIANIHQWRGNSTFPTQLPVPSQAWGHLRLEYLNSAPAFWNTHWFSQVLSIGSSPEADLCLPTANLDPIHAYIHHQGKHFWIENASSEGGGIHLNHLPLACNEIAPLIGGFHLSLGGEPFEIQWLA